MNISFIIPAYNEELNINKCLFSIIRACNFYKKQNKDFKFEIIVVDNNSNDRTKELADNYARALPYHIKVIEEKEKGVTRARQKGYLEAKYEIQAYIDADNVLSYYWLFNISKNLKPDVVGLSGSLDYYENNIFFRFSGFLFFHIQSFFHQFLPTIQGGNFIVKKSALDKIGGHSINYDFYGEDTDLAKRLSKFGKIKFVSEMKVYTSNRRFRNEGVFKTMYNYIMSYLYVNLFNKAFIKEYKDYR